MVRAGMFFGTTPEEIRKVYVDTFRKHQQKTPLSPLEADILDVILRHPEYHDFLQGEGKLEAHFLPELGQTNPFLHMGLHLAIREQVQTNRPQGIAPLYKKLLGQYKDLDTVEHAMMERLAEALWQAQRSGSMPDETVYLQALQSLLVKG